ncbi:MAG: type II toxin-antitoxin system HipA family toxin [Bacteroidales bacterium]|nr:type II toxin-antitoxin system HipA family toxin [Bacteroidales bacterium]
MNGNVVKVSLWGKTVGYLTWDKTDWRTESSVFQFDREYLSSGWDISPLLMPLDSKMVQSGLDIRGGNPKNAFSGLPAVFADSLPDHWGNSLFRAWAKEHKVSIKAVSPVDYLSFIGKRGMGALEYLPAAIEGEDEAFDVDVNRLYEFAKSILEERNEVAFESDRELLWRDLIKLGTSPGGKRPKALIAFNPMEHTVKSGQVLLPPGYEYYVLKYDNESDLFPYARIEYAYSRMCKDAGIIMPETELRLFDKATHFIIKRFDRKVGEKVHMQSLRAINGETGSYEEAFDVISRMRLDYVDKEQLFRRMVFNVVAGNIDDHDKNISFLMDKNGTWSLAPAYDVVFSIDPNTLYAQKGQFMSVNGKNQRITVGDILTVARTYSINRPERIIEQIMEAVSHVDGYLKDAGVKDATIKVILEELNEKHKEQELVR